jgi:tail sheath protein
MPGSFNKGPGIYLKEIILDEVATPVGNNASAIVIRSNVGPTNQRVLVSRDQELIQVFGEPSSNLGYGLYAGLEMLKATSQLYVVRATSGTENYAHVGLTTSGSGVWKQILATPSTTLLNVAGREDGQTPSDNYDIAANYSFAGEPFVIGAIGPGAYGNNLAISIVTCASPTSAGFDWQYKYDSNPFTDLNAMWSKVFKINVFQKTTNALNFNSVSGSPVETFYVSRQQISDDNGNNLYLEDVINGISKFIYVKDNLSVANTVYPGASTGVLPLLSGTDNTTVSQGNIGSAWNLFADRNKVDLNIILCTEPGDKNSANYATQLVVGNIASSRKDCIAVVQVDGTSATVSNPTTMANNAGYDYDNPSYVAPHVGWDMIFDRFNDRNIYIPGAITGAALMAKLANPWDAPAGIDNGKISSLARFPLFSDPSIAILDDAHLNTSKFIRGQGNVMWLQSTALRKNSALASINVRRLLLFVENTILSSLLTFIYKPNNAKTRQRIKTLLDNFLKQVAAGGGFNTDKDDGFMVVCDSTNNTSQVIDNEQLVVDIFVKPIRTIKYLSLNMIVTNSGISFSELV